MVVVVVESSHDEIIIWSARTLRIVYVKKHENTFDCMEGCYTKTNKYAFLCLQETCGTVWTSTRKVWPITWRHASGNHQLLKSMLFKQLAKLPAWFCPLMKRSKALNPAVENHRHRCRQWAVAWDDQGCNLWPVSFVIIIN